MSKRGKVLRDPFAGPGLLMIEGQQYPFVLEGVWQSEEPAKPGLVVDVDLDTNGKIQAIRVVPEALLVREQAEATIAMARQRGAMLASGILTRFGRGMLVAACVLIVAWFFLSAMSIETPLGRLSFTFWDVLSFVNANNIFEALVQQGQGNSAGIYGVLAALAIAGPFLRYFWREKWALAGGFLPLIFMLTVGLVMRVNLQTGLGMEGSRGAAAGSVPGSAMSSISLGAGTYVSVLVCVYFAGIVTREFLVMKGSETQGYGKTGKLVA